MYALEAKIFCKRIKSQRDNDKEVGVEQRWTNFCEVQEKARLGMIFIEAIFQFSSLKKETPRLLINDSFSLKYTPIYLTS